ncbi:MAG TPA: SDR family NAD(P)-dependent oxidoreductase, partial [Chloroflexota bacterium]
MITETAAKREGTNKGALAGKVAIVTGASRGIGAAIARLLASEGSGVVVNYASNAQRAEAVAEQIQADGRSGGVLTVQADISDEGQTRDLVEKTVEHFGRLDILVNNAGITRDRTFRKMTPAEWLEVVDTNLNGV